MVAYSKPDEYTFPYELTAKEYLYIQLCQSNLTNNTIADVLGIGKDLVHKKQQKLFKKFNAKNRSELVRIAIEKNIIKILKVNN